MTRRSSSRSRKPTDTVERHVPPGLRTRLEGARLDVLSLLRALDSLLVAQDIPDELRALFELDADFAEALAVLDHPPGSYNLAAMVRDTLASLDDLPQTRQDFLDTLAPPDRERIARRVPVVRATLAPEEAYSQVPKGSPRIR